MKEVIIGWAAATAIIIATGLGFSLTRPAPTPVHGTELIYGRSYCGTNITVYFYTNGVLSSGPYHFTNIDDVLRLEP